MQWPLHTFVVPLYNGAKHIQACLENIYDTRYPNYEVIVVDDGSTDNSVELVKKHYPEVTLLRQPNQGPAAARNTGLLASAGEFISFLDHDDLFTEGRTMEFMEHMLADPELDIVSGRMRYKNEEGADHRTDFMTFENMEDMSALNLNIGSMLYRRSIFDRIGHFADTIFSEDVDFFIRIRESKLKIKFLRTIGLIYRLHDTNMTRSIVDGSHDKKDFLATLHRSIKRRRSNPSLKIRTLDELDPEGTQAPAEEQ